MDRQREREGEKPQRHPPQEATTTKPQLKNLVLDVEGGEG